MIQDIPVDQGTLTAKRVDANHIEFVRDHGDGIEHRARMYVFSKSDIAELRAGVIAARERISEERRPKIVRWLRRVFRVRAEANARDQREQQQPQTGPDEGGETPKQPL